MTKRAPPQARGDQGEPEDARQIQRSRALGNSDHVRLGAQGLEEQEDEEGSWDIAVSGPPRLIEAHSFNARGWKIEFVEELPAWK